MKNVDFKDENRAQLQSQNCIVKFKQLSIVKKGQILNNLPKKESKAERLSVGHGKAEQ